LDILPPKASAKSECVQSEFYNQILSVHSNHKAMNKIIIAAVAITVLAMIKMKAQDKDDNPAVTPAQKADRIITFYKA
jgi:hypothetical protein